MSESIVVGTNGSETARRAVAEAARLAVALGAEVHVVSAYEGSTGVAGDFVAPPPDEDVTAAGARGGRRRRCAPKTWPSRSMPPGEWRPMRC